MKKEQMFYFISVVVAVVSAVLCHPPFYSVRYAQIRYQPQRGVVNLEPAELDPNSIQKQREEVTEKSSQSPTPTNENKSEIFSSVEISSPMTTERESEQINFAGFSYDKITKDKLKEQAIINNNRQIGSDEQETATEKSNFKSEYKEEAGDIEDDFDESDDTELTDLNEQGVYYIIHPNGLFQKVVYKTQDEPENMQFSTHVQYENVAPIVEPIYMYDPSTFVFQRLLLRPERHI